MLLLRLRQHILRVGEGDLGGVGPAHHLGDLFNAYLAFEQIYLCRRAAGFDGFGYFKVPVSKGGYLGQMGDENDLAADGQFFQFLAGDGAQAAPDLGIDLVKNKHRDRIDLDQGFFKGQHQARCFS